MNELVKAAKDSVGLASLWFDDEQFEMMINAVLSKVANYSDEEAALMATASSSRLNRILRICRDIKWADLGEPAMKDNATRAAMHDLACLMMQDALEREAVA